MENKNFMTVDEVAQELNVSKSYAYKVVRELNAEMQKLGYLTVTGRVNTNFFRKKLCYDNNVELKEDWKIVMSRNPKVIFYAHANERVVL